MSQNRPDVLSRSVQETDIRLQDLKNELELESPEQAYGALRAVMHALRDRITVDMAANLSSQLPVMLTGIFFDGWKPADTPQKYNTAEEFLERVRSNAVGHSELDVDQATRGVFRLLEQKLDQGQINRVTDQLPDDIQALVPRAA
ncbi:uncharacterized protein (DUF2267 family) [Kushneria sinocarnis]|uniref:Uncharacterized protein (DUF2267 family) n=1 Tax=Kushneria sinocarnis TaxID=595502 RepID=A0A420WZ85_9GAMM|nr:DUF2267 domain-containing protein [Kushneria sinocarnis]RKR06656.1 uncharacterized protein (DUF2267 family) [Kushneria sinocarnis]